mgnify:CR=1 FL=1
MGVAPEATAECLHLGVGSTLPFHQLYIFYDLRLISSITYTADESSPRAYVRVLAAGHMLQILYFSPCTILTTRRSFQP